MAEMTADVYDLYGAYYISEAEWSVDIGSYNSGRQVPESGSGEGDFLLAVYNAAGGIEWVRYFDPRGYRDHLEGHSNIFFYTVDWEEVPVIDGAHAIGIGDRASGEVLWEHRLEPDQRPEVEIIEAPEGLVDEVTISWTGSDPEGRELTYGVAYSYHEGRPGTWGGGTLAYFRPDTTLTFSTEHLRGSVGQGGKLRVIAHNGVNFSVAETGFFQVPIKPPVIEVVGAMEHAYIMKGGGAISPEGLHVKLSGVGGAHLSEDNITWHSDKDGFVGRGERYWGSTLSAGYHNLFVQVEDARGDVHVRDVMPVTVVDTPPEIIVRVGDGQSGDLACNELELDVEFGVVHLDGMSYGFNQSRNDLTIPVEDELELPIRYQMTTDTDVNVWVKNSVGMASSYREIVPVRDCNDEAEED